MQNREDIAGSKPATPFFESHEKKIILLLCIRLPFTSSFFPPRFHSFNNVDEVAQFDLVLKYSHGRVPHEMSKISPDSADYVALMNSYAYFGAPDKFPGGKMPQPLWTEPAEKMHQDIAANSAGWQRLSNYEVSQSPLYYVLAGSWWHVGKWLGFHEGRLVYWLRFLNIIMVIALVWLGYAAARMIFPESIFLRLGVPALLTFMPQSAFYSIGNDMTSSLCFGLTFICLLKWLAQENPSVRLGAATGLAFAATYLSKMTNLPLLAIVAMAILIKIWQEARRGRLRAALPALMAFLCFSEPPIIAWMMWCKLNFGDLAGSSGKAQFLGWTVKSFSQWWSHPIFTPVGLWTYLSGELNSFWQGEFVWHYKPMALPATQAIFTILSLALVLLALPGVFARAKLTRQQHQALRLGLAFFVAALGFFALLSIVYDFHDCPDPSREHPYFSAGRMMLGMLIPFLLLIVYGLDRALNRFGNATKFITLSVMICAMLITETATNWPVFANEYNWFHLP